MSTKKLIDILLGVLGLIVCIFLSSSSGAGDASINLYKCPEAKGLPEELTIPNSLVSGEGGLVVRVNDDPLYCLTKWIPLSIPKARPKDSKSKIKFTRNGELFLHSEYFNRNEFCISRNTDTTLDIGYCEIDCEKTHICIHKCCGLGKVYNISERSCVPSGEVQWSPTVYSKDNYKGCGQKVKSFKEHISYSRNICPENQGEEPYPYKSIPSQDLEGIRFRLLDDGKVVLNTAPGAWTAHKLFCIDGIVDDSTHAFTGELRDQILIACRLDEDEEEKISEASGYARTVVYVVFLFLGIFFLVLTAIVYLLLWDKHNIHGWTVFSFVISMLFFFIVLVTSHIAAQTFDSGDYGSTRCKFIAIIFHLMFLCTMCWMSVINVDLWLTFRSLSPSSGRSKMIQRYFMYASFAIGVPVFIVVFGIILDAAYLGADESECGVTVVNPKYGQDGCRLPPSSEGLYIYLPMGILLGSNVLMFSSTVFTLYRYRKTAQNAINNSTSGSGNQNQSLVLFCKLFVVMGITWVTEIISWCLSDKDNTSDWYLWVIFDIINLLQAVAVFFIFACKRENLVAFNRKYPRGKKFIEPIMRWGPCRTGTMEVEQTDMTSADKNRIDRNTKVNFSNARISTASQDDF